MRSIFSYRGTNRGTDQWTDEETAALGDEMDIPAYEFLKSLDFLPTFKNKLLPLQDFINQLLLFPLCFRFHIPEISQFLKNQYYKNELNELNAKMIQQFVKKNFSSKA